MKKYIALLTLILINIDIYAESYIFGGKAQFMGALINQGCFISLEAPILRTSGVANNPLKIYFSSCPVDIYDHLVIGLSKHNERTSEVFFTNSQAKNNFDKEINIQGFEYISLGQRLIDHIVLPISDQNSSQKKINIFFNKELNASSTQVPHIVISVFYP
ncbi:hypothetical protein [Acinetobacter bereziniae]|uniref:hypothetical protein n=1 Tax=Acinetobacter bereziniae TaxID=106648 RepID=UPI001ABD393D|nr:hypothetical protein [Acinetobacter bereziniae]MBO3653061.1 hypothetical protein [Acinetobacter bereziniae]